jgi:glycosyltransferase involved in cell wall biosynthesis
VPKALRIATLSYAFEAQLRTPQELLARYDTLGAWASALREAGAGQVDVWQRFRSDADLPQEGFTLHLRRAGPSAHPRPWTALGGLHGELAGLSPDVVHVHGLVNPWPLPHLRARLAARTALVLQDHAASGPPAGLVRRLVWRRALALADAFLFTASEQAEPWRAAGLISEGQPVHAVPEASRSLRPLPRAKARKRSPVAGQPALLWVGRLHPVKDPLTLLAGFEQALAALPHARLTMVFGSDELLPDVRARLARSAELQSRVLLVGRVPLEELPAFYGAADAFVAASRREGSGYALLEALAAGLLPVITDIPSFRALTAGGRLARLWAPGDAQACGVALRGLASADLVREPAALREHFERELSWPAVGRRALAAYQATLEQRRQRGSR